MGAPLFINNRILSASKRDGERPGDALVGSEAVRIEGGQGRIGREAADRGLEQGDAHFECRIDTPTPPGQDLRPDRAAGGSARDPQFW